MGIKVGVNPPKTPVTEGSGDVAPATTPNVCKMPGPPAPFVPTPLPNVGRSSDNLTDGTTKVLIEGKKVAIKGSSFKSAASADAASKGTGGGVVSSTEQGKTEFTAPGSMNVKAEGENIQVLGDAMINNNQNGGANVPGNIQPPIPIEDFEEILKKCANNADREVNQQEFGPDRRPPQGWQKYCKSKKRRLDLGEKKHKVAEACVADQMNARGRSDECSIEQNYEVVNGQTITAPNMVAGGIRPDVVLHQPNNPLSPRGVYDFKFSCVPGGPASWRTASRVTNAGLEQNILYHAILKVVPKIVKPGRIGQIIL